MFAIVDTFFFKKNYNSETKILKGGSYFLHTTSDRLDTKIISQIKKQFNKDICPTLSIIEYEEVINYNFHDIKKYVYDFKIIRTYNIDRLTKLELLLVN